MKRKQDSHQAFASFSRQPHSLWGRLELWGHMDRSRRCIPNQPQWDVSQQYLQPGWTPSALAWGIASRMFEIFWQFNIFGVSDIKVLIEVLPLLTYTHWDCREDRQVEPLDWILLALEGKLWQCRSQCSSHCPASQPHIPERSCQSMFWSNDMKWFFIILSLCTERIHLMNNHVVRANLKVLLSG